jgi:YesN/AraC family two-component response regulator
MIRPHTLSDTRAEQILRESTYRRREEGWHHVPYDTELAILRNIKQGDVNAILSFFQKSTPSFPRLKGHLSDNAHRQAIYEFVAMVTLITRFAIEGGLDTETAFGISDAYIKAADRTTHKEAVYAMQYKAVLDFTKKVQQARTVQRLSPTMLRCMDYIDRNLHAKITLDDLAQEVGRNAAYLCVQFKGEVGISLTQYINQTKVEAAKALLNENVSIIQVSTLLGFCSQSYFSKVFKDIVGETPRSYQLSCFRNHEED